MSILDTTAGEKLSCAKADIPFVSSPENTVFWSKGASYMTVRKSAANSETITSYFKEFAHFKTAVDQLELTRSQDRARVWLPGGDQIIGKGLERVTVLGEDASIVFSDVNETLIAESAPVVETLAMVEAYSQRS